jgi:ABC-2 type transport system permease protein
VTTGPAEVFDLGYRGYEGERTGRWLRRRAIWRDGIRVSLGLGRGTGAKVAPWLLIGLALVPMVVLLVVAAFVDTSTADPDDFELPSYAEYYEWAVVPLGLFAAVVAPLLLCPDRRDGVLALYAARPITPLDYVASRWGAFLTVCLAVAWLPEALLFAWNALDASDPGSFLTDEWDILPRSIVAAVLVATVLTTLALFVSSFATRRAYATVAMLAVIIVGSAIGGIADENFSGSVSDALSLASIPDALIDAVHWLFGDEAGRDRPVSGWVSAVWLVALTVALGGLLVRRTKGLVRV